MRACGDTRADFIEWLSRYCQPSTSEPTAEKKSSTLVTQPIVDFPSGEGRLCRCSCASQDSRNISSSMNRPGGGLQSNASRIPICLPIRCKACCDSSRCCCNAPGNKDTTMSGQRSRNASAQHPGLQLGGTVESPRASGTLLRISLERSCIISVHCCRRSLRLEEMGELFEWEFIWATRRTMTYWSLRKAARRVLWMCREARSAGWNANPVFRVSISVWRASASMSKLVA